MINNKANANTIPSIMKADKVPIHVYILKIWLPVTSFHKLDCSHCYLSI